MKDTTFNRIMAGFWLLLVCYASIGIYRKEEFSIVGTIGLIVCVGVLWFYITKSFDRSKRSKKFNVRFMYFDREIDPSKEHEFLSLEGDTNTFGFRVEVAFHQNHPQYELPKAIYYNVTEVHWNYENKGRVAIESDIHSTGTIISISEITEIYVTRCDKLYSGTHDEY